MSKKESQRDEQDVRGLARLLQSLARWRPLIIPAMIVGFVAGAIALWWRYGDEVVSSHPQRYRVELENVLVTDPPAWVKADVRSEVFHDAGWHEQPLSILENDLTVRVAQAFEQHTWVAKVSRVRKQSPATVKVELQYRRPVAMVEVDYQGRGGLLPVDAEGVLLPPEDFTPEEAVDFPRITVDYSGPSGSIGTSWGDDRVAGAAKIAAVLIEPWQDWGLYRIVAQRTGEPSSRSPPSYELHTRDRTRVLWGSAPGDEAMGEATAEQKVVRLARYVEEHGPLDGKDSPAEIDVRSAQELSVRRGGRRRR